jgi:hypothetical protein
VTRSYFALQEAVAIVAWFRTNLVELAYGFINCACHCGMEMLIYSGASSTTQTRFLGKLYPVSSIVESWAKVVKKLPRYKWSASLNNGFLFLR